MRKKIISSMLALVLFFSVSKIAFAATTNFNVQLPTTGSKTSNDVLKETSNTYATYNCSYFGWPGSGVDMWVQNTSNSDLSSKSNFSGTGVKYMYLSSTTANKYKGQRVHMKAKTDSSTWPACDIIGVFDAQ